MTMLSLTENECAWIEFIRLISCDSDPVPDLISVQTLGVALGGRKSDPAPRASLDPKFRNQGAPFPSSASVDPTRENWTATAFSTTHRRRPQQPCRGQVGGDGAPCD